MSEPQIRFKSHILFQWYFTIENQIISVAFWNWNFKSWYQDILIHFNETYITYITKQPHEEKYLYEQSEPEIGYSQILSFKIHGLNEADLVREFWNFVNARAWCVQCILVESKIFISSISLPQFSLQLKC